MRNIAKPLTISLAVWIAAIAIITALHYDATHLSMSGSKTFLSETGCLIELEDNTLVYLPGSKSHNLEYYTLTPKQVKCISKLLSDPDYYTDIVVLSDRQARQEYIEKYLQ